MVQIQLDEKGLVPAIAQNVKTGEVLMLGYMNPGSLKRTLEGGEVWFYSRSRSDLWHKGEVSGNYMRIKSAAVDCDGDTIILQVEPDGPICHTGNPTCFFTPIPIEEFPEFTREERGPGVLEDLFAVIQDRKREMPEGSYTAKLLQGGTDRISQKVIEEAGEAAIAGVKGDKDELVRELAGIGTFELAEQALARGDADIIAAARASLADPDWFRKVELGRGDEVRRCIYTNYCEGLDQRHKQVTCQLWDRDDSGPAVPRSRDGKRRLVAPEWRPGSWTPR